MRGTSRSVYSASCEDRSYPLVMLVPRVLIKKVSPRATVPAYQSARAAGLDLAACLPEGEQILIRPGEIARVPIGIAMAIPDGFEGQVRPRSGLASKHGVTLPNAPGTIDADYRGEVLVPLINLGREAFEVTHGLRVAQMVIAPCVRATLEEVSELDPTERGHGGFGSTGTR